MALFINNGKALKPARGFTFVELMVVMAIIAMLIAIALPRYFEGLQRAREAVLMENLNVMRKAIDHYHADKNSYPANLQTLVSERYLKFIPEDPITNSTETWQIELPPDNANQVYDVHSGSSETASNGTLYNAW
jgi:general secretion pathway protein G